MLTIDTTCVPPNHWQQHLVDNLSHAVASIGCVPVCMCRIGQNHTFERIRGECTVALAGEYLLVYTYRPVCIYQQVQGTQVCCSGWLNVCAHVCVCVCVCLTEADSRVSTEVV
jgi:hypothetical protein